MGVRMASEAEEILSSPAKWEAACDNLGERVNRMFLSPGTFIERPS